MYQTLAEVVATIPASDLKHFKLPRRLWNKKRTPATLYYVRLETPARWVWKLGYTTNRVSTRMAYMIKFPELINWHLVDSVEFSSAQECWRVEQWLHAKYKPMRTKLSVGLAAGLNDGHTEIYNQDIFSLDIDRNYI